MPGSVAHMLIFQDVISRFETDRECDDDFVNTLKENINYGRLGSLGPDLPTYEDVLKTASSFLLSKYNDPVPIETWSGQLHNKSPNVFPLKMIEIAWRETDLDAADWDDIAKKQWAFIIGFLTHMAADQTIHPYINKIAGQYYRLKENRLKHIDCEIYQDVIVFKKKFRTSIRNENLGNWVDIRAESGKTEPYFRIFLQKSFVEAHGIYPSEHDIESWVRGLLFIYKYLRWTGLPYKAADTDIRKNNENSVKYQEYWLNDCLAKGKSYEDYYRAAVELASIYAKAAYQLYEINHIDFNDENRRQFLKIVINADLANPLESNILGDAKKAYSEYFGKPNFSLDHFY